MGVRKKRAAATLQCIDVWLLPSIREYGDTFSAVEKTAHHFYCGVLLLKQARPK
jgi:hypothetical protein